VVAGRWRRARDKGAEPATSQAHAANLEDLGIDADRDPEDAASDQSGVGDERQGM
jgi:hypothetical protein